MSILAPFNTVEFDQWYDSINQVPVSIVSAKSPAEHATFHMSENGTFYFGDAQLTSRHIQLLDRLLRQEFPEEFI